MAARDPSSERSDDEFNARELDTPTRPRNRNQRDSESGRPRASAHQDPSSPGSGRQNRQYCTQKCLLGLIRGRGTPLDEQCPNVLLHQGRRRSQHHPVDHATWLSLLRKQLTETLDDGIVRLGKQGARGVLFQVTLLVYGYTFVSKGTVPEFVPDIQHEATVYRRLQRIQGTCVPVFLGTLDLRDIGRTYYYDFRVRIIYMMFLSWSGDSLDLIGVAEDPERERAQELVRSVRALHTEGVVHRDVRLANALWSCETRRVMLIDFERAVLLDHRPPLANVVPNKRPRQGERAHRLT